MKNFKQNWYLILIGLVTLVLGIIAVVTTIRIYKVGKKPIAPTAPMPAPAAQLLCQKTFTIAEPTPTPTPTPTITLARCYESCGMISGGSLVGCISGLQCLKDPLFPLVFKCRNPQCPTQKNCVCAGTTPTPTGTRAPTPTPTTTLSPTPTPTGTLVPTPTPTGTLGPTPTPGPTATPTPIGAPTATPTTALAAATPKPTPTAYAKLPEAGFTLPTIGALFGAIVLVITSLILIF